MTPKKHTHHHDRRFSGDIDRLRAPDRLERIEAVRVVDILTAVVHSGSVLDIGTGTGVFAEEFRKRGLDVAGIDVNEEMLRYARTLVPEGRFQYGAAESLPFPDNTFDLAFLGHVLHETDDPLKALREARRVSRKVVAVLEWPYVEEEHGPPLEHRIPIERIEDLARRAGFAHVVTESLNHMILFKLS